MRATRSEPRPEDVLRPPEYVFIVGMARTGTDLTRRILNRSKDVSLGSESHVFEEPVRIRFWANRGLRHQLGHIGDLATDEGAARIVDHVYETPKGTFWGWIVETVERDEFLRMVLASDRSERALLEIALRLHCRGRRVCGEKTPDNIYAVPTLLAWFPGAKVVHTVRDPRGAFTSLKRKRQNAGRWWPGANVPVLGVVIDLYASLRVILAWHWIVRLHRRYQRRYPDQYLVMRFEDLVTDPTSSIQRLCDFLGIDFSPSMLDQSTINSSFRGRNEKQGFDRPAMDRWRTVLHPLVREWFRRWCAGSMREFGYQP